MALLRMPVVSDVPVDKVEQQVLKGINNPNPIKIVSLTANGSVKVETTIYNQYLMNRVRTFVEKGIDSKNSNKDKVYFANPVVRFTIGEVEKKEPSITEAVDAIPVDENHLDVVNAEPVDTPDAFEQAKTKAREAKAARDANDDTVDLHMDNCGL